MLNILYILKGSSWIHNHNNRSHDSSSTCSGRLGLIRRVQRVRLWQFVCKNIFQVWPATVCTSNTLHQTNLTHMHAQVCNCIADWQYKTSLHIEIIWQPWLAQFLGGAGSIPHDLHSQVPPFSSVSAPFLSCPDLRRVPCQNAAEVCYIPRQDPIQHCLLESHQGHFLLVKHKSTP